MEGDEIDVTKSANSSLPPGEGQNTAHTTKDKTHNDA